MEPVLDKVKDFAERAHGDQVRKFEPAPYIVHPVRVMETIRQYSGDLSVLSAALLHDVLEDTDTDENQIRDFLHTVMSPEVAVFTTQLVVELTDVYTKQNYPAWNRKKRKTKEAIRLSQISPEAQTIKYADILDNTVTMLDVDAEFRKKFLQECRALLDVMQKGHSILRKNALEVVSKGLGTFAER